MIASDDFDYLALGEDDVLVERDGSQWRACKHCGVFIANRWGFATFSHRDYCPIRKRQDLSLRMRQDEDERSAVNSGRRHKMIGEDFLRDFFHLGPQQPYTSLQETFGREVVEKALELSKGCAPESNLMPYIQIVLDAKRLGLTVTRNS